MGAGGNVTNRCNYRYAGCVGAGSGERVCDLCRREHNRREAARRAERREQHKCWVCGDKATKVNGEWLKTCGVHREYYRLRATATP